METKKSNIKNALFIIIPVFLLLACGVFSFVLLSSNSAVSESDSLRYAATVCKQVVRADGIREPAECSHNVLYNTGRNITRDFLIGTSGTAIANITLCNATTNGGTGCGTPIAAASEAYNEYTSCGLHSNAVGTISVISAQPGNWTVYKTFTSTCNNMMINVTRLGNNSVYFAGNPFTLVTLQANDQLTVNWTVYLL